MGPRCFIDEFAEGEGREVFSRVLIPLLAPSDLAVLARTGSTTVREAVLSTDEGKARPGSRQTPENPLQISNFLASAELLQWAMDDQVLEQGGHTPFWDERLCALLARKGELSLLKHVRASGRSWDDSVVHAAAAAGNIDILEWILRENRENPLENQVLCVTRATSNTAAAHGHIDLLLWLSLAHFIPFVVETAAHAAKGGQLETLVWLTDARFERCPTDYTTLTAACDGGHMDCLRYVS